MIENISKYIKEAQFLNWEYWFRNPGPSDFGGVLVPTVIFAVFFLLGAALTAFIRFKIGDYPPKVKILEPLSIGLLLISTGAAVFLIFRFLGVGVIGIRFFALAFALALIAWTGYFLLLYRRVVPKSSIEYEAASIKSRYLKKNKS
jgi:hypothetical protein